MYASFYGHFKIATILLENGALVDVKNNVSFSSPSLNVHHVTLHSLFRTGLLLLWP